MLLLCQHSIAQIVEGRITDESGRAIPFVSVSSEKTGTGTSSNAKGFYSLKLSEGKSTVIFSHLGYELQTRQLLLVRNAVKHLNITLKESTQNLKGVDVIAKPVDRAKLIMQHVRKARKSHLDAVRNYFCSSYTKTSVERISRKKTFSDSTELARTDVLDSLGLTAEKKRKQTDLIEVLSSSYFSSPQSFKEQIIAIKEYNDNSGRTRGRNTSFSFDVGEPDIAPVPRRSKNPYILYQDNNSCDLNLYKSYLEFQAICTKPLLSPLAFNSAFSYKFNYLGNYYVGDMQIHRISLEPLFKSESLFSGIIEIIDGVWSLYKSDLSINKQALVFCKSFALSIDYSNDSLLSVPIKKQLNYSIKDGSDDVEVQSIIEHDSYIINQELDKDIFRGELLEFLPDAFEKDSIYWQNNRKTNLSELEHRYAVKRDSIVNYYDSDAYKAKMDSSFNKIDIWTPIVGLGRRNRIKGTEWYIEGILSQVIPFGIGGYRHRLPGYFQKEYKNAMVLETKGHIDYGFANKDIKGKLGVGFTYMPKKFVRTYIEAGDYYEMINNYASVEQIFSRSNYARTHTYAISQRMEIINGLFGELRLDYSDQIPINNLQFSKWSEELFGELNEPVEFKRYTKSEISLELKYIPGQKYYYRKGKKVILGSKHPTFRAKYRKGIPNVFGSEVNFDYIELEAYNDFNLARLGNTRWRVNVGSFVNKKSLRVLEYKFFRGSDQFFFSDPLRSLQLLGPTLTTPNEFLKANVIHHFNGTILNKVPIINKLKLGLAGGAAALLIPDSDFNQFEFFAGLERPLKIKSQLMRLGLYAVTANNNLEAANVRLKFGLSFFNSFTRKWDY